MRALCRYGSTDADVLDALRNALVTIRNEVLRRGLPGPLEPLDSALSTVQAEIERTHRTT